MLVNQIPDAIKDIYRHGIDRKIILLGKNPLLKIKNKQKNVPGEC